MLPGDRLVCAFVESQTVGFEFKQWLLHVTIVPWFRLDDSTEVIARGLEQALHAIEPFEAVIDGDALLAHQRRQAKLMRQPTPFILVEEKVRGYFHKKRAWLVDETTKRRYDFLPHVTIQHGTVPWDGDIFSCDRLYIVEQKGDYKEIMSEVRIGE